MNAEFRERQDGMSICVVIPSFADDSYCRRQCTIPFHSLLEMLNCAFSPDMPTLGSCPDTIPNPCPSIKQITLAPDMARNASLGYT